METYKSQTGRNLQKYIFVKRPRDPLRQENWTVSTYVST